MIRWIAVVFAAIVLALAAAVAYLGSADLGRHKEQLTPLVSNALGRELRIDGKLSLHLGSRSQLLQECDHFAARDDQATIDLSQLWEQGRKLVDAVRYAEPVQAVS